MEFETRAIHAGQDPDPHTGAVTVPIYATSTYAQKAVGDFRYDYSRTANPTREADVDFQMVDVNLVLRQMQGSGTRLNMVILDACRNNPFGARGLRASDGGLAQIERKKRPADREQEGRNGRSDPNVFPTDFRIWHVPVNQRE